MSEGLGPQTSLFGKLLTGERNLITAGTTPPTTLRKLPGTPTADAVRTALVSTVVVLG